MANDSEIFRLAAQLRAEGFSREGIDWVKEALRYVPLYEAKLIHQFDHRWATFEGTDSRDATTAEKQKPDFEAIPRYWVPKAEVSDRLAAKGWTRGWLMGWRDITNATNERIVIAAAFPRVEGPLFRPLKHNGKRRDERRGMDPDAIDRVVRKYAATLGLDHGYSAHSMRATFITTALENGAQLEDVQKAAGHRDPNTTKLYDRRGYNPEKAASFFATY